MRFFSEHRVTGCGCQSQKSACLSVRLVRDKLTRTAVQAQGRDLWAVAYPELGLAHVQRAPMAWTCGWLDRASERVTGRPKRRDEGNGNGCEWVSCPCPRPRPSPTGQAVLSLWAGQWCGCVDKATWVDSTRLDSIQLHGCAGHRGVGRTGGAGWQTLRRAGRGLRRLAARERLESG
jgi:hypothetical protein